MLRFINNSFFLVRDINKDFLELCINFKKLSTAIMDEESLAEISGILALFFAIFFQIIQYIKVLKNRSVY